MFSVGSGSFARASGGFSSFRCYGSKTRKNPVPPVRRRGCSSLLRCRLCVRRGCSRLLFKITIRKCWSRLHCALCRCTLLLLCYAHGYNMHGFTLVYYVYTSVDPCIYMHGAKQSRAQWLRAKCSRAQHFRIAISNSSLEQPLPTHRRHRSRLVQPLRAHWRHRAALNSLFQRFCEPT